MFARVIPIRRLPRNLASFDYLIPTELEDILTIGQMVCIPFQSSEQFGIVEKIENNTTNKKLKTISKLVHAVPFLSVQNIKLLKQLSDIYGVSPGTIYKMALLPLQKQKLKTIDLIPLPKKKKTTRLIPTYRWYQTQEEQKNTYKNIQKNTLILVASVHAIEEIKKLLPKKMQKNIVTWHSTLSTKEQFAHWLAIRNQEKTIIIGTRGSVLIPFPELKYIIIEYEHDEQHKHWDQAPRFDVRDIAPQLAIVHGAKLIYQSYSPHVDRYFALSKKIMKLENIKDTQTDKRGNPLFSFSLSKNQKNPIKLISLSDERRSGNFDSIAEKVKDAILETNQDIFLYINRRGYASSISCKECTFVATCTHCQLPLVYHSEDKTLKCHYCHTSQDMFLSCPHCHAPIIQLHGMGTEQITSLIKKLIGQKQNIDIIRIDSGVDIISTTETSKQQIIIGTQMAFPFIQWKKTGLIIFLDIDHELNIPEYRADETVWHIIQTTEFLRRQESQFMIQTYNLNHLIFKSLYESDRFYRTDLNHRKGLGYPPYAYLVRYFYGHPNQIIAKQEAENVFKLLKNTLTQQKKDDTLIPPIEMQPRYYRKRYWYMILVKLPISTNLFEEITKLNHLIPQTWKIDPNPINILSP